MSKKMIIKSRYDLDLSATGVYANAHDALSEMDREISIHSFLGDRAWDNPPPQNFRLSVRVTFRRVDGKIVTRRILARVRGWSHSSVSYQYWGDGAFQFDEIYHGPEVNLS